MGSQKQSSQFRELRLREARQIKTLAQLREVGLLSLDQDTRQGTIELVGAEKEPATELRGDSWMCRFPESLSLRALKKLLCHHPKNRSISIP